MNFLGKNGIAKKQGDVLFYEGPLISHFKVEDKHYFCKSCDVNDKVEPYYHTWLFYQIEVDSLKDFFSGKTSLRKIIDICKDMYLINLDGNLNCLKQIKVYLEELDKDLLPTYKSTYRKNHYTKYCQELKNLFI